MTNSLLGFSEAVALACRLHANQQRRLTNGPYVAHLLRVAGIVLEHGGDETAATAAVLHDAIEDQGGADTREMIRDRFGDEVTRLVDECSDTDQTPKPPWQARKEAFLEQLDRASPPARLIVAADKLDNARSLLESYREFDIRLWDAFRGGREGTLWYFRSVVEILASDETPLVRELTSCVKRLEEVTAEAS